MDRTLPGTESTNSAPYPTLRSLDRACGDDPRAYASDPNAIILERLARVLTREFWSETAWLTGMVTPSQLAAVCERLDTERDALLKAARLFVATEIPDERPVGAA